MSSNSTLFLKISDRHTSSGIPYNPEYKSRFYKFISPSLTYGSLLVEYTTVISFSFAFFFFFFLTPYYTSHPHCPRNAITKIKIITEMFSYQYQHRLWPKIRARTHVYTFHRWFSSGEYDKNTFTSTGTRTQTRRTKHHEKMAEFITIERITCLSGIFRCLRPFVVSIRSQMRRRSCRGWIIIITSRMMNTWTWRAWGRVL